MGRVNLDAKSGDALYVLERFLASPKGQKQALETSTDFIPGQLVKFKSSRWNGNKPGWFITFEHNNVEYEATQDYFIAQTAWNDLLQVFGDEVKINPTRADNNKWTVLGAILGLLVFALVIWICSGLLFSVAV